MKGTKRGKAVTQAERDPAATSGGKKDGAQGFSTIDPSFCLTRSQLEEPLSVDPTQQYNGQPTSFTDLQSKTLNLDPSRAAMLLRSNFLPYDGVLYEINDAPIEQEALWSFGGMSHLTYNEYLKVIRDQKRMQLQNIVVKQNTSKAHDYSRSPHRPMADFFNSLVIRGAPRLRLLIPNTLVLDEGARTIFFTDASGFVRRIVGDKCDDSCISEMFGVEEKGGAPAKTTEDGRPVKDPRLQPIALMKRASSGRNEITLLDKIEFWSTLRDPTVGNASVQTFIKPRGSHPAMYRTNWRRSSASTTVLVSGSRPMGEGGVWISNSTLLDSNTVLSFRGAGAKATQDIVSAMVFHLEQHGPACRFDEVVCDFLKSEDGSLLMLQVKAFVCQSIPEEERLKVS